MLNFFRKIRQALLLQNKLKTYILYAIGEIILVVIGILLALSVNSWNSNRLNDKQETIILQDLKTEYLGKLEELNQKISLRNMMINSSTQVLEMIHNQEIIVSIDTFDKLVGSTFLSPTFDASNSVSEELINSGKLYLVKNIDLRRLLTNWSSELAKLEEEEQHFVTLLIHNYLPYLIKKYPYNNLASFLYDEGNEIWNYIVSKPDGMQYRLQKSNKSVDTNSLLKDIEFESYIAFVNLSCTVANMQSHQLSKYIKNVLEVIEKELEL